MAGGVWSGYLTFGLISMPVRLFPGARGERIGFHMLHRDDNTRIKQQLYCPTDERVVERNEIVKGYEYRKGEYVIIEPEEIKKIEPKTSKAMEILEFVPADEVDPIYFETSYYLVPDEAGRRPYALLAKTLSDGKMVGIAKITMHNREYTAVLRPYREGILLQTIYYADEVREIDFGTDNVHVKEGEVKVAHQLVKALEGKFEPKKFHDTFEDNVKKLIKAKLEGTEVVAVEKPKAPAKVVDLMDALKQSLAQMEGKKKGPGRVSEAEQESRIHVAKKKGGRKKAA